MDSRICATLGVAHDASKTRVRLHLLLEHVECDGDLHDTIHGATHWERLHSGKEETRTKSLPQYGTSGAEDDAWAFVMPRAQKVKTAVDLAW